jgi:Ca-activated chloride channel family protein
MSFSDMDMLWLIWMVPILFLVCYGGLRKRNRILSRYATARGLAAISPDTVTSRRWLKAAMLLTVVVLVVISLAGPQYGYQWREIEQKGVDLIIALDCSKSMLATDIQPTRLDRAKREVVDLLNLLQGDRVGLVAFSGTAFLQCPLTLDYAAFHLFLSTLTPDFLPVGGTNLGTAIETALSGFKAADVSDKAIILITDGESTGEDPLKAAQAAADAKVRLFCIGVGARDGVPIPIPGGGFVKDAAGNIILTRLDEPTLKKVAVMTGGSYVRSVAGNMDLETIYMNHIRKEMEATTLSQQKKKILEDRYQWFLALAVLILVLELVIPLRKKGAVAVMAVLLLAAPAAHAANPDELIKSGETAYNAGEYDKAVTNFIDAQLEAPDRPEIYYNMGNAQYKAGKFDAALKNYQQALKSEDPALREKAHYNIGNTLFRLGKHEEAIKSYETALKLNSKDVEAEENLAFVKKAMAQPKPPPQKDDTSKEDQKDPKDPKNEEKKKQEEKQENPASPPDKNASEDQSGREKENPDAPGQDQPDASTPDLPEKKTPAEAKPEGTAQQKAMDEQARQQAEKMLNRLEDKPGRALIPQYQKRRIEKDW